MKRMNEEQLLHLGRYLIPSGDPPVYINHTRQGLFGDHTAVSAENWAHKSKLDPQKKYYLGVFTNPTPVTHTDGTGGMGHSHKNLKVSHHWLEAAPVNPINHSFRNSEMMLPQVSLWFLQLLTRHKEPKIRNSPMTWWLGESISHSTLCLCSLICQTRKVDIRFH